MCECVIICDIEGAEFELLDPASVPELTRVDMLVEIHRNALVQGRDTPCPELAQDLSTRFAATHAGRLVCATARTMADLPPGVALDRDMALRVMDEMRGGEASWLWLKRK